MSTKYKFNNKAGVYFVSFATVGWIDVFTRQVYRDLFLESLVYCRKEKGLNIHAWVLMSNHVHLIISSKTQGKLADVMRDLKKYTAYKILKEIKESTTESRKEWMLFLFAKAGKENSNNTNYQFWRQDSHRPGLSLSGKGKKRGGDLNLDNSITSDKNRKPGNKYPGFFMR